jgi:hypothetical protein
MLTAPTLAQIHFIIHERIRAILAERVGEVGPLSGAEKLSATLGLSSLDLAFLVADLEAIHLRNSFPSLAFAPWRTW